MNNSNTSLLCKLLINSGVPLLSICMVLNVIVSGTQTVDMLSDRQFLLLNFSRQIVITRFEKIIKGDRTKF